MTQFLSVSQSHSYSLFYDTLDIYPQEDKEKENILVNRSLCMIYWKQLIYLHGVLPIKIRATAHWNFLVHNETLRNIASQLTWDFCQGYAILHFCFYLSYLCSEWLQSCYWIYLNWGNDWRFILKPFDVVTGQIAWHGMEYEILKCPLLFCTTTSVHLFLKIKFVRDWSGSLNWFTHCRMFLIFFMQFQVLKGFAYKRFVESYLKHSLRKWQHFELV